MHTMNEAVSLIRESQPISRLQYFQIQSEQFHTMKEKVTEWLASIKYGYSFAVDSYGTEYRASHSSARACAPVGSDRVE